MSRTFEQIRLDNIKAREQEWLDLGSGGVNASSAAPIASKPAPKPRTKKVDRVKVAPEERRMSSRQRTKKEDAIPRDAEGNPLTEEEIERLAEKELEEQAAAEEVRKAARHAKRAIAANTSIALAGTTASLNALLKNPANFQVDQKPVMLGKREASPELSSEPVIPPVPTARSMSPKSAQKEDARLEASLSKLVLRGITKVVSERVYSLVVHPSTTKDLVFVGDKIGNVGLWDAGEAGLPGGKGKQKAIKSSETSETRMGMTWSWLAHGKNSVSCLKIAPVRPTSIYSSAYDCTIRQMEFENQVSEEMLDISDDDCLVSAFDITLDGRSIWASDNGGGINHRDVRQKISTAQRWQVDKTKIGCISLNPANQNLAITSHNSREVRIWDLRKLVSTEDVTMTGITEQAVIARSPHGLSTSGCYFDATGTKACSTSYDNRIRLWTGIDAYNPSNIVMPFDPYHILPFDCQTGRYLTILKPHWSRVAESPSHFMCGSMSRSIDIFSGTTGATLCQLYDGDHITAVPTVTGCHPVLPNRYFGATAAGKVSFFGLLEDGTIGEEEEEEQEDVKQEDVKEEEDEKPVKMDESDDDEVIVVEKQSKRSPPKKKTKR